MSYVVVQEDRFTRSLTEAKRDAVAQNTDIERLRPIRRPLVGLEIKDDTHAMLEIRDASGQAIKAIKNTSTKQEDVLDTYTSNFSVESITEQRNEKSQIVQTFGDDFIYFFGERPVQLNISLILVDSSNFMWHQEFWENYSAELRGTSLARKQRRAYFKLDDRIFEGVLTSANFSRTANAQMLVRVQVQFLVTNTIWLKSVTNKVKLVDSFNDVSLTNFTRGAALATSELTFNLSGANYDPVSLIDIDESDRIDSVYARLLENKDGYIQDVRVGDYVRLPSVKETKPAPPSFELIDRERVNRLRRIDDTTEAVLGNADFTTSAPMRKLGEDLGSVSEPPSGWDTFLNAVNYAASAVATAYYVSKIAAVAFGAAAGLVDAIVDVHRTQGIPNYLGGLVVDFFDFTVVQPVDGIVTGTTDAYRDAFSEGYNVIRNEEMEPTTDPVINFGSGSAGSDVTLISGAASSPSEQTDPVI